MLALESHWEEERASLRTIYWATQGRDRLLIPLFSQSKQYCHVSHVVLPVTKTYFRLVDLRLDFPDLPVDLVDHSILVRFGEFRDRPYTGSTFLQEEPVPTAHLDLPPRFVVLTDSTPANCTASRALRDWDASEWQLVLDRLDKLGLCGVVLNSADAPAPPDHPRVLSRIGLTLGESIAVLRKACGYWGILSQKIFGSSALRNTASISAIATLQNTRRSSSSTRT